MTSRTIAHTRYWQNTLADANLGRGAFSAAEYRDLLKFPYQEIALDVPGDVVERMFEKTPRTAPIIDVVLRPYVFRARHRDGNSRKAGPAYIVPLISRAKLDRTGRIWFEEDIRMARDLLEPLERGAHTIGSLDVLDGFLAKCPVLSFVVPPGSRSSPGSPLQITDWNAYVERCEDLLDAVCGQGWLGADYCRVDECIIEPGTPGFTYAHILPLYEDIAKTTPDLPLFETYCSDAPTGLEPCRGQQELFARRLGHSGPEYALAPAQRGALTHLLHAGEGEIVAVNGPPGTGKTTLLLSVVATLWAEAAVRNGKPPIIVAASANNQAVTNIIDAFAKDYDMGTGPLAGRWIPDIMSFGAYYPSNGKEKAAAEIYQTHAFFEKLETAEFVGAAEAAYLVAARVALPELKDCQVPADAATSEVVRVLNARLQVAAAQLAEIEAAWRERSDAREDLARFLGNDPAARIAVLEQASVQAIAEQDRIRTFANAWERHLAHEPLAYVLLGWLGPVARQRERRARLALGEAWSDGLPPLTWSRIEEIAPLVSELQATADGAQEQAAAQLAVARAMRVRAARAEARCLAAAAPLCPTEPVEAMSLAACDALADTTIRFEIFRLTTHYWEGRWLLEMRRSLEPSPVSAHETAQNLAMQWMQRAMLTPCVVSTFHMLPRHLSAKPDRASAGARYYLYNHADLLIVDEAGQVTPELAGASFALARRALVIGDTLQIEPIASVTHTTDGGNLVRAGLLARTDNEAAFQDFVATGKACSAGSVMHIAQRASRYHQEPDLARGLMLLEHRRCFDEIVTYCNRLSYHGKLLALRGSKAKAAAVNEDRKVEGADGYPAMGYVHIDGACEKYQGRSRRNRVEAETIANWIVQNRQNLETHYARPLAKIVGIVTPFGAQLREIVEALKARGISGGSNDTKGAVTVGTVHALQGAQRPVVLFSPVYSKHDDGNFIDQSGSMLNVAVSRAMNTFLVFGDIDVMAAARPGSPRDLLYRLLKEDSSNALPFAQAQRRDLVDAGAQLRQLQDAKEHDVFLAATLERTQERLDIVSPWISLSCIQNIGLLARISDAVERNGVAVSVYVDRRLNLESEKYDAAAIRAHFSNVEKALNHVGARLIPLEQIHSKIVIADNETYCVGSFNWLSASRSGEFVRAETSLVYRGNGLEQEIAATRTRLDRLAQDAAARLRHPARR